jgi:hypothetical protein
MDRSALIDLVIATVQDYCTTAPIANGAPVGPSTRLFGPKGVLDSLGLVSVVVEMEQRIRDEHRIDVSLMDDRAMSQTHSPFRTPETLAGYILGLQAERKG